ncbi:Clp protease N-terminal domain-containing protein [Pseudothermotoga sp.]
MKDSNPEHVLLQILYDGNNEATKLLEEMGIDTSKITGELEESVESQYGI